MSGRLNYFVCRYCGRKTGSHKPAEKHMCLCGHCREQYRMALKWNLEVECRVEEKIRAEWPVFRAVLGSQQLAVEELARIFDCTPDVVAGIISRTHPKSRRWYTDPLPWPK